MREYQGGARWAINLKFIFVSYVEVGLTYDLPWQLSTLKIEFDSLCLMCKTPTTAIVDFDQNIPNI